MQPQSSSSEVGRSISSSATLRHPPQSTPASFPFSASISTTTTSSSSPTLPLSNSTLTSALLRAHQGTTRPSSSWSSKTSHSNYLAGGAQAGLVGGSAEFGTGLPSYLHYSLRPPAPATPSTSYALAGPPPPFQQQHQYPGWNVPRSAATPFISHSAKYQSSPVPLGVSYAPVTHQQQQPHEYGSSHHVREGGSNDGAGNGHALATTQTFSAHDGISPAVLSGSSSEDSLSPSTGGMEGRSGPIFGWDIVDSPPSTSFNSTTSTSSHAISGAPSPIIPRRSTAASPVVIPGNLDSSPQLWSFSLGKPITRQYPRPDPLASAEVPGPQDAGNLPSPHQAFTSLRFSHSVPASEYTSLDGGVSAAGAANGLGNGVGGGGVDFQSPFGPAWWTSALQHPSSRPSSVTGSARTQQSQEAPASSRPSAPAGVEKAKRGRQSLSMPTPNLPLPAVLPSRAVRSSTNDRPSVEPDEYAEENGDASEEDDQVPPPSQEDNSRPSLVKKRPPGPPRPRLMVPAPEPPLLPLPSSSSSPPGRQALSKPDQQPIYLGQEGRWASTTEVFAPFERSCSLVNVAGEVIEFTPKITNPSSFAYDATIPCWRTYRRNFLSLPVALSLPASAILTSLRTSLNPLSPIVSVQVALSSATYPKGQNVELLQFDASRKLVQAQTLRRQTLTPATSNPTRGSSSSSTPALAPRLSTLSTTFTRVQYRHSTANHPAASGESDDARFVLRCALVAVHEDGTESELGKWASGKVVVRGRSPGNFDAGKGKGKGGKGAKKRKVVEEEEEDEGEDDDEGGRSPPSAKKQKKGADGVTSSSSAPPPSSSPKARRAPLNVTGNPTFTTVAADSTVPAVIDPSGRTRASAAALSFFH